MNVNKKIEIFTIITNSYKVIKVCIIVKISIFLLTFILFPLI